MEKNIGLSILVSTIVIAGALVFVGNRNTPTGDTYVAPLNGTRQIVDINARGGYSPRLVQARAGVETLLRITTKDTYDCSVSLVIPKLSYDKFLSPTGTEEIVIPAEKATGTINGLCSMGMYSFKIVFKE